MLVCLQRGYNNQRGLEENTEIQCDNLAGDMTDPRRKNRLHCVLKAVITSSEPFETRSTGSLQGDRAKAHDILADATIDPLSNTRPHRVRSWLSLELQCPRWCFDQCAGCAASEEGRAD